MLALAYDAALRREELCSLRTDDLDPAHRDAAGAGGDDEDSPEPMVPYSAAAGALLAQYLTHGARSAGPGGRCFCPRSRGATGPSR